MKVSFCITCMGRLHHLKETLPKNLADNPGADVEFVILNYNSQDGLSQWMLWEMSKEIHTGRVVHYHERDASKFFPAHAKNIAHGLSTGEIVCSLDADDFTGAGLAAAIEREFRKSINIVMVPEDPVRSLSGIIALWKPWYTFLGGYDEDLTLGYGFEDSDLRMRAARKWKLDMVTMKAPGMASIPHSDEERTKRMGTELGCEESNKRHQAMIASKVAVDSWGQANKGRPWGKATVYRNFGLVATKTGWRTPLDYPTAPRH